MSAAPRADTTERLAVSVTDQAVPQGVMARHTPPQTSPRLLLPILDAAATLGVGRSMLYELAARGEVEIVKIGTRALVPLASCEAYVERLRTGSTAGTTPAA